MQSSEELLKQNLKKFKLKHFVNNKQKEAVKAIVKRKSDINSINAERHWRRHKHGFVFLLPGNQDAIVSMGPGNRKSLCFQLPGIMHENRITIVCSPSNSSIRNQMHYLKKSKIGAISITSQLSDDGTVYTSEKWSFFGSSVKYNYFQSASGWTKTWPALNRQLVSFMSSQTLYLANFLPIFWKHWVPMINWRILL